MNIFVLMNLNIIYLVNVIIIQLKNEGVFSFMEINLFFFYGEFILIETLGCDVFNCNGNFICFFFGS